jgi:hypothetical protein
MCPPTTLKESLWKVFTFVKLFASPLMPCTCKYTKYISKSCTCNNFLWNLKVQDWRIGQESALPFPSASPLVWTRIPSARNWPEEHQVSVKMKRGLPFGPEFRPHGTDSKSTKYRWRWREAWCCSFWGCRQRNEQCNHAFRPAAHQTCGGISLHGLVHPHAGTVGQHSWNKCGHSLNRGA